MRGCRQLDISREEVARTAVVSLRQDAATTKVVLGGLAQADDLQRISRAQGIKTFIDLTFTYSPQSSMIWMEAVAFRASDGGIVWSQAARSDGTTAMLLRTGRRPPSQRGTGTVRGQVRAPKCRTWKSGRGRGPRLIAPASVRRKV